MNRRPLPHLCLLFCVLLGGASPAQAGFFKSCWQALTGETETSAVLATIVLDPADSSAASLSRGPQHHDGGYRDNAAPAVPGVPTIEEVYGKVILALARQRGVSEADIAKVNMATLRLVPFHPEGIFMGATFVTQFVYFAVTGVNPSHFHKLKDADGDYAQVDGVELLLNHPVESVTRDEENRFFEQLSEAAVQRYPGIDGRLRRPTEKEWLAADGGEEWSDDAVHAHTWAWRQNDIKRTLAVALKPVNSRGIYESRGHVWSSLEDLDGSSRVLRGGSWYYYDSYARLGQRYGDRPGIRGNSIGFRVVRAGPFVSDIP